MNTAEIRRRFLAHFEARGHTVVPSASLIAKDPTLLVVNAGMVPFKPYFLGEETPEFTRATSVQKCVRTVDIDNVGKTARHASFFQMCGNFSFGDYFKEGAIGFAWELLTDQDKGYGFDPERLWATVYQDDDEAAQLWLEHLPADRIQRRGKEDNYWSMGVPGPCGPCSEIYFDRGPEYGKDGGPAADEERYLEVWNLVFMQYERGAGAGYDYPILGELPARNIDTGMGLERMATILQGVDNLYEIDISRPVLDRAGELVGQRYGTDHDADVALRVIADHTRTAAMLIADGVTPSNEGRGYVLRRMLRRAIYNGRLLGGTQPIMGELFGVVRDVMGPIYPELVSDLDRISRYAVAEEEAFLSTLRTGSTIFDNAVAETRQSGSSTLSGDRAFQLHDTYGFPIDLTLEMAARQGLSVDEDGFRRLMTEQRQRGKEDRKSRAIGHADVTEYRSVLDDAGESVFTGYVELERDSVVRGILARHGGVTAAEEGDEVEVVLDVTPFYAEGGGQQPDTGRILFDGGELEVFDVQRPVPDLIVHRAKVLRGELRSGAEVHAVVDFDRRRAISRSHTATHLVHRAFRGALGESATQAGSENAPGRLRFDFANPAAVPPSVLEDVESEVNEVLLNDLEVHAFVTTQDEARRIGAMALFGEKYGDQVRVVDIGDYSRELCGGTHVARSAQLGGVKLLGESSIGAGVRRVEALVGIDAFRFLAREHVLLSRIAGLFRVPPDEAADRVEATIAELRAAEKELERLRAEAVLAGAGRLAQEAKEVGGVAVVLAEAPEGTDGKALQRLVNDVRGRVTDRPAVVAIAVRGDGKASIVIATNEGARDRGLAAGDLVRAAAVELGGKGGGKPDLAQGGGSQPDNVPGALAAVERLVGEKAGS
jgi:alanyl-tRNA synthetase